ncbi:hypothetical protein OESDEN_25471 [Oesophagostomum dentatum]|uniref:Peptidase A1 domain-containing protein n=1 Tax=Oesophagostomum dentatum TaxID=61180 RepID=A0A0B1RPD2_OESDE|nr:hypothetical protein OESDEN_25471 [Oesophagostomum dentatum]
MNTTPQGGLLWRFGAPFNRQYCVVFDIAKKQIGFTTVGTNSTTARPPITTRRANVTATRTVPASTRRTNVTVTRTVPTSTRR